MDKGLPRVIIRENGASNDSFDAILVGRDKDSGNATSALDMEGYGRMFSICVAINVISMVVCIWALGMRRHINSINGKKAAKLPLPF